MSSIRPQPIIPFQNTWTHRQSWDAFALNLQACYDEQLRQEFFSPTDVPLSMLVELYEFDITKVITNMAEIISNEHCAKAKGDCSAFRNNKKIFNSFNYSTGATRQSMVDVLSLETRTRADFSSEAREATSLFLANASHDGSHDLFEAKNIITVLKYTKARHEARYAEAYYDAPIWGAKFDLLYRKLNRFTKH